MLSLEQSGVRFATTHPSLLAAVRDGTPEERRAALDSLVRAYWPAVYSYLRRSGRGREDAAEITQAFFAEVGVERGLFDQASPQRGRLRTLVLTALKRALIDRHRRAAARGGSGLSLDGGRLEDEERVLPETKGDTPEEAFDRRWALTVFHEAMERCRAGFEGGERDRSWRAFEARVLHPATAGVEPVPLAELAGSLGFRTPADAAAAVQWVRKRAAALIREVASETADDPAEQEEEYRLVMRLLA